MNGQGEGAQQFSGISGQGELMSRNSDFAPIVWVYLGLTSITASELNVLVREQRALGGLEKQIPGRLHQIRSELMSNIPSEMQDCQAR